MDSLVRIALIGISIGILIFFTKSVNQQFGPIIMIAGAIFILGSILSLANGAIDAIKKLFEVSQIESENIKSIVKIVGGAYIVDFAATLCRDIGESSIASKIELAGRVYIVLLAVPWAGLLIEAVKSIGA